MAFFTAFLGAGRFAGAFFTAFLELFFTAIDAHHATLGNPFERR